MALPNKTGISISSNNNTVGAAGDDGRNIISGNSGVGVWIDAEGGNTLVNNYIGLGLNGTTQVGNGGSGVVLAGGTNTTIGGTGGEATRNVISGNGTGLGGGYGIFIGTGISGTTIQGNYIGTDATGTTDRGNWLDGVFVSVDTTDTTLGGSGANDGNVISANGRYGVSVNSASATVQNNWIGYKAVAENGVLQGLPNEGVNLNVKQVDPTGRQGTWTANEIWSEITNRQPQGNNEEVSTRHNTPVVINVLANDTDPDGDTLTVTGVTQAMYGSVAINPDSTITYTPFGMMFASTDSFQYTIDDGYGGTATATVTITLTNQAPAALDDLVPPVHSGPVTVDVLANDSDPDGDALTIIAVGQPQHGMAFLNPNNTVTYAPSWGYSGTDSFTYTVSDGHGGTATATVTVSLVNQAPVLAPIADRTISEGWYLSFAVSASDPEGDFITYSLAPGAPTGAFLDPFTGLFSFYAADGPANFSITVVATDSFGASAAQTFVLAITNVAPTAVLFIDWSSANNGVFAVGTPIRVELMMPQDPSMDDWMAGFRYSFDLNDDGDFDDGGEANLTDPWAYFTFSTAGTHRILCRISDKDGGFTDYWQDTTVA